MDNAEIGDKNASDSLFKRKGAQSSTEHIDDQRIRDIGKRTRTRFEEEKSKRKEIVRIDDHISKEKISASTPKSSFLSSVKKVKTSQRPAIHRRKKNTLEPLDTSEKPSHVDLWFPKIKSKSSIKSSRFVRIHGLPSTGTTLQHIRRYFLGLNVQEIFLLPKLNLHVPNFDADVMGQPENSVERFPNTVRVIVKFPSSNVADIAVDRSGETMDVGQSVVAVSVSPVEETITESLQKMAISLSKYANITIDIFIMKYMENIPECINSILWYDVLNRIRENSIPKVIKGNGISISSKEIDLIYPTRRKDEKNVLIELHNKLFDMHTDIEERLPHVQLSRLNPIESQLDVSERLAIEALKWLEFQTKRIEKCLLHADVHEMYKKM
jgi:hypothetical protein